MVQARRPRVTRSPQLSVLSLEVVMRALHVICSLVLSVHVEGMAFAQTEEPVPAPASAGKSAEQEPTQPHVTLKPARERGELGSNPQDDPTMALTPGEGDDDQDYSRCISDWDAATHMTKQEWQAACRRALKDYPGAFRR